MPFDYIIEDHVVIFSFRNGRMNSITGEVLKGLKRVIEMVDSVEELKGLILTGNDRYFSSGFDLQTLTAFNSADELVDWFAYEEEVMYKLFTCDKPVIAAINGHATAAGMIVIMACDYRMALNLPNIKIGMPEINIGLGLTPVEGEIMRFGLDNDKNFRDIIWGGQFISPREAFKRSILDELIDNQEELIAKAKAKVRQLIDKPGRSFIMLKRLQKRITAEIMLKGMKDWDGRELINTFNNKEVMDTLKTLGRSLERDN